MRLNCWYFVSSAEAETDKELAKGQVDEEDLSFSALYAPVRALFCADPKLLESLGECRTHLARLELLATLQVLKEIFLTRRRS
jgi:hypothetical protein